MRASCYSGASFPSIRGFRSNPSSLKGVSGEKVPPSSKPLWQACQLLSSASMTAVFKAISMFLLSSGIFGEELR
jgi:hypothetical protein